MNPLPFPQSSDPNALVQWGRDLVRDLELRTAGQASSGASSAPAGTVFPYSGSIAPAGYLALLGQLLPQSEFPELFRAVGRKWSNEDDALDMFRLIDGTGRTFVGGDGSFGGSDTIQLGLEHLPEVELSVTDPGHSHAFSGTPHSHSVTDPGHTHSASGSPILGGSTVGVGSGSTSVPIGSPGTLVIGTSVTGVTVNNATAGGTNSSETTGIEVNLNGGGEALSIVPLFFSGLWIIKT